MLLSQTQWLCHYVSEYSIAMGRRQVLYNYIVALELKSFVQLNYLKVDIYFSWKVLISVSNDENIFLAEHFIFARL